VKIGPIALLHKFSAVIFAVLKPLGVWGIGGLALIDSALIPIPVSMDGVIIGYVASNHKMFLLYSLMAAFAAAIGSLVPSSLAAPAANSSCSSASTVSAMRRFATASSGRSSSPSWSRRCCRRRPPLKLFQFAAGVFEMKPVPFVLAVFCGKLTQFLVCSLLTIWLGPTIFHTVVREFHHHFSIVLGIAIAASLWLVFLVVRKLFDREKGLVLLDDDK
jgi:membrane protein YqaA with SNARE-associated domain